MANRLSRTLTGCLSMLLYCLVLLVGCTVNRNTVPGINERESSGLEGKEEFSQGIQEPLEFTIMINYEGYNTPGDWGNDHVSRELLNSQNVIIHSVGPGGIGNERLNLLIASDELPDAIVMDRDASWLKLIELGLLTPLDEYIEKYSGYRSAVMPEAINMSRVDGQVYGLLNWSTTPEKPVGNSGWGINEHIYETMGSPVLETLDDLYRYLTGIKEAGILVNGKPVIPLQFEMSEYAHMQVYAGFGGNRIPHYYMYLVWPNPETGSLEFFMRDAAFVETMVFVNRLWRENLMNQDCFIEKKDQVQEKLNNGRVAVYTAGDVQSRLRDANFTMREEDEKPAYRIIEPIAAPGVNQMDVKNDRYNILGWNALSITTRAAEPEGIYRFFDWLITPEGQTLSVYGPKGILWDTLDEQGYPILKNRRDVMEDPDFPVGDWYWNWLGNTVFVDSSKVAADMRKPVEQRDFVIQAQHNILWKHSLEATEFENLLPDPATDLGIIEQTVSEMVQREVARIIMAKDEMQVRAFIQDTIDNVCKAGFDRVEQYKTDLWLENKRLLGKE